MAKTEVITLDLNFQGMKQAIAVYLIKHSDGRDLNRMRARYDPPCTSISAQSTRLIRT